ncbi:microtubule-associated protein futsch [Halyomorpha halys]|uniref:microtubule-associated protein futsch n=1 Tax=Halyomorpha halys TaxID=286706 RepID=UPI0006D4D289|nr:remodeling and spacing factor 1-like [Halyomorpha halys]
MATEKEASPQSCASDPNFAVICSFLNQFAASCGIAHPTFSELQEMLEDTEEVSQILIDLHIKLLRKARKSFTADKWEKALAKFCHTYSQQDGWELERFGYKKARLGVKVKLLKVLLETQFDVNGKFKSEVNKVGAKDLRLEPLGRDQNGFQYWCQFDKSSHVRIYREDLDDETWELVASDRDGLVQLIDSLSNGEGQLELNSILNEDSTSQEIEKPITDTGQEEDKQEEAGVGDEEDGDEGEEEDVEEEEEEVEEEEEEEEEGDDGDEEDGDEGEEEDVEEEEEEVEEEEEEEEEGDDDELKEKNEIEQKTESVQVKSAEAVGNQGQEKPVELTNGSNTEPKSLIRPVEENISSLTGVDLSIKSDSKKYLTMPTDYYTPVPERPYIPERNDILSQMSARFNDTREAEDLSLNPAKKLKLDDDQPMMLVKKNIVVSEVIEEPVRLVTGPGSGEDCQEGNPVGEPEFSEVIEEPVQYVVGVGSGVECDVANPKYDGNLDLSVSKCELNDIEEEPEFSEVIEEPVLFFIGLGSGAECDVGNPRQHNEDRSPNSHSGSTMGIECSLKSLSLATHEPKFSDVIEEPVMFVHGSGNGEDCLTGNPDEVDESIEDKSPEKKPKLWSIDAICESIKQNSSESSQKDPKCDGGSSKMSEGNGTLNCTKGSIADEGNISPFNLSNNINSSLKPFSGVKPILENIPMKDKPPDSKESDIACGSFVPEGSNDIGSSNCMSSVGEDVGSIPSSNRALAFSDISLANCISDEKSTKGDQPSNTLATVTDSNLEIFSEDNSRTSIILENLEKNEESSSVSGDLLENHSSSNLFINKEEGKCDSGISIPAQRNPSESLELDIDPCPNVNSAKSNSKRPNLTKSNKNSTTSNKDESVLGEGEIKCDTNKSVIEKCENDNKISSLILDKNMANCENGSTFLSINCSVVCEKLTNLPFSSEKLSAAKFKTFKSSTYRPKGVGSVKSKPTVDSPVASVKSNPTVDSPVASVQSNPTVESPVASVKTNPTVESPVASVKSNPTEDSPVASVISNPTVDSPVASDKTEEKRKNVMLTNIIEVCLDNDNFSKDNVESGLKGQLNAKFNDLFSAKNLLEPTRSSSEDTSDELDVKPKANIPRHCLNLDKYTQVITITDGKVSVNLNSIKREDNQDIEEVIQNMLAKKAERENKVKCENDDSIKLEEIKEENSVNVRNVTRGRKSRTNSLNNDEETEIPNKIRKTEGVQVPKARRVSRRKASCNSQNEVCLEPIDDKAVSVKGSRKKTKNDTAAIKDPANEDLCEEKTESKIEQRNENDKAVDEVEENEEKKDETNDIPKTGNDEIDCKSNHDNEDSAEKSVTENKGFTLASFSLEQPLEDGPVLGEPPEFKPQPSRKRRNSRKLSRSEEDGGELDDEGEDGEEAGGKKPRLRAKTRRSRGTPPSTKHVQPEDSSSDDDKPEENTDAKSKDKRRSRGRPLKKKGINPPRTKSKSAKAKETEKSKEKGSDSGEESESEKEDEKQATKKDTRKKQQSTKEESEKEEKQAKKSNEEDKKQISKKEVKSQLKVKGKSRGRPKKELQSNKEETGDDTSNEGKEEEEDKSNKPEVSESKVEEDDESKPAESEEPKPKKKGRPKKQKTLLGLLDSDLIHSKPSANESEGSRVRQSRRIAQIKIKEEAERRAIEEATMMLTVKEKKKSPKDESGKQTPKKQKKKKGKSENASEEEDETFKEPVEEKKKGRKKKKKKGLTYDINKPWQSSSDDSSEEAEEEEEHFEEEEDEEDIRATKVVSDHEFSPESDLEKDETVEPIRRARTAKKVDEDEVKDEEAEVTEDYPCKKCGQPDHPEWILLCDKCDSGFHASCLRPTLMLIPEGDWFCPPCQHLELVSKLKETLRAFEKNTKRRENEELRKKRLAYVGISLANVLPSQEKASSYGGGRRIVSESSESSSEESESSDEEPVYQLRQRRAALQANYRFNDYDDLINSAIQDEMEAVKGAGNMGRGKDIANIIEAEKKDALTEENDNVEGEPKVEDEEQGENWRPPVVPKNTSLPSLRKKPKKLTDLDKQSEDDADSDEDFKGSSEDEEFSSTEAGDSDDSIGRRQPVRRSSRARISRIDKEFINDDSESSDEPRRKKTRRIWASSSSESSDTTWGRRKRKTKTYSRIRSSRSSKKKKKMVLDSDSDRPKKIKPKRPKIRYGLSEDEGEPLRRTRGKKMSYLEVAGSDTEEEVIARSRKLISEEEEEFVPEKEEVGDEENEPEEVEPVEDVEEEEEEDEDEDEVEEEEEEAEDGGKVKVNSEATKENEKKEVEEASTPVEKETVKVPVLEPQNEEPEPVVQPQPEQEQDPEPEPEKSLEEEDDDDDQVEEEEIEEEVEEEVEEEEEEEEDDDSQIEEVKNLVREKVEEPKGIIQPPIKLGSGVSIIKVPMAPAAGAPNPTTPSATATAIPTPVIKEEKKEPTPAIRLVPSAKLLDPNKRRPPEESVIRGMLGGGGYYRPQPMQAPGRQPFRQRFPDQQRYLYQPSPHQYYPGGAFYAGEDYVVGSGYEEQMDPNAPGGDEEGVFSGLVSYFSSQREDNLDS